MDTTLHSSETAGEGGLASLMHVSRFMLGQNLGTMLAYLATPHGGVQQFLIEKLHVCSAILKEHAFSSGGDFAETMHAPTPSLKHNWKSSWPKLLPRKQ